MWLALTLLACMVCAISSQSCPYSEQHGSPLSYSPEDATPHNRGFAAIIKDDVGKLRCCGVVTEWQLVVQGNDGTPVTCQAPDNVCVIDFIVWTDILDDPNSPPYQATIHGVNLNYTVSTDPDWDMLSSKVTPILIPPEEQIPIYADKDYYIGWNCLSRQAVDYIESDISDNNGACYSGSGPTCLSYANFYTTDYYLNSGLESDAVLPGANVSYLYRATLDDATFYDRFFAINAVVGPGTEPRFIDPTETTVTVPWTTATGSTIYTATAVDDESLQLLTYRIVSETPTDATYFSMQDEISGNISTTTELSEVVGTTRNLTIEVSDGCLNTTTVVHIYICCLTTTALPTTVTTTSQGVTTTQQATTTPIATTSEPITTTPVVTTSEPITTTPVVTTSEPITTTPVVTTSEPITTTPVVTTSEPITTTPVVTTSEPITTTPVVTTSEPITTTPVVTTSEPITTTPVVTTSEPITTTPVVTTSEPITTTPVVTTSEPITTTPVVTTSEPITTTPVVTTSEPITTTPVVTTSEPITTTPVVTTSEPITTTPVVTTSEPITTTPVVTTSEPITTTPVVTTSEPITTTPVVTTTQPEMTTVLQTTSSSEITSSAVASTSRVTTTSAQPTTVAVTTTVLQTTTQPATTTATPTRVQTTAAVITSATARIGTTTAPVSVTSTGTSPTASATPTTTAAPTTSSSLLDTVSGKAIVSVSVILGAAALATLVGLCIALNKSSAGSVNRITQLGNGQPPRITKMNVQPRYLDSERKVWEWS